MTGGSGTDKNRDLNVHGSLIQEIVDGNYTVGPVLNEARYWHGCINFVENGKTYIMVSGGMGAGYKKSVEILDADDLEGQT